MTTLRRLLRILPAAFVLSSPLPAQETWESWTDTIPSVEAIEEQLALVRTRIDQLPEDAPVDSPARAERTALTRRDSLLGELGAILERGGELSDRLGNRVALEAEVEQALAGLDASDPRATESPTPETIRSLEEDLESLRAEVQTLRGRLAEAADRTDSHGTRQASLKTRAREADGRAEELVAPPTDEDQAARALRELRLANARLDARTARAAVELLERERDADGELGRLRRLLLELAERRFARTEQALEAARSALATSVEVERQALEEEIAATQREAGAERDPIERFLAEKEIATLTVRANTAKLEPRKLELGRAADEQSARLDSDRLELERLRKEVSTSGTGGRTGTRLRETFRRLESKRRAIELAVAPDLPEKLGDWRTRRFDLDEILYQLGSSWRAEVDALAVEVGATEEQRASLRTRAALLREDYRIALEEERAALTEAISGAERLRGLQTERFAALQSLEGFVHARVFWIRDGSQLDLDALRRIPGEARGVAGFVGTVASSGTAARLLEVVRDPVNLVGGLLLLLAIPAVLVLLRRILRRWLRELEDPDRPRSGPWHSTLLVLAALVDAVLLPAYLVVWSRALDRVELPADASVVLASTLLHVALFLFLWRSARHAFGKPLLAHQFLGASVETCRSVRRTLRTGFLAYLVLLLPWLLLRQAPFGQEVLPHVALVAFLVLAGACLHRLFHSHSPLVRDLLGGDAPGVKRWGLVWDGALGLLLLGVPALTASGFTFAASAMGRSLVSSLATLVVLPTVYRAIRSWLDRVQARRAPVSGLPDEATEPEVRRRSDPRVILRAAFVVTGLLLFASYWGINQQAWNMLEGVNLWRANSLAAEIAEYVTASDLVLGFGTIALTLWLLRHLPGIYDLTLFPRMNLDAGLRYAIVTMSRYGLFFVGFMIALSFIHLDLTRLGWLVAAMGVGLGFGLQEIVSNFVSGIILLVERPIRVGDLVTIGTITGRVQRINIRATTVLNFDRLEVIVPNRSLITKEVTNWTLADEMTRLIVPIGVAYGSDIEQVRSVLLRIVREQPEILPEPGPQVVFVRHGDSSLDFEIRCFLGRTADRVPLQDRLNTLINGEFEEHGIEIPFPQRDLHLKTETLFPQPPRRGDDEAETKADEVRAAGPGSEAPTPQTGA